MSVVSASPYVRCCCLAAIGVQLMDYRARGLFARCAESRDSFLNVQKLL